MNEEVKVIKKRARKKVLSDTGPLACKPMKGYHLRWANINDPHDPMNIQTLMDRGYTFVTPKEQGLSDVNLGDFASVVEQNTKDRIARTGRDGITCMLMKLPEEDYQEDLRDIKEYNDAQVAAMMKPKEKNQVGLKEFGESVINGKSVGK